MSNIATPAVLTPSEEQAAATPISEKLATFASDFRIRKTPQEVVDRAKLHILDCLGIGLASTTYDFSHSMANAIHGLAGDGPFPVIGLPMRLPLRDSVHVNGTLIHGLDYDDTHSGGVVHASASAAPTAIGMALAQGATGPAAFSSYLVAVESSARIGMAVNGNFHRAGHHPTGLVGAFGCTLAAGRLADLTVNQLAQAQGVTLSMAAGSLEFLSDGAWTKRQHPGWAGVCGITAATLAKNGFVGPMHAYEGRYGLYNLHLGKHIGAEADYDLSVVTDGLGETWELLNVAFKPYPACHFNHAFADAAIALREEYGLRPEDIASVTARIAEGEVQVVCEPQADKKRPRNSYEAQFSVHYIIAAALTRGHFGLDELDASAFNDARILDLCDKVTYEVDPDSKFPRYYSGEVAIRTKGGQELRHREEFNRGADANPMSPTDIETKFWANATRAVSRTRAQQVVDAVMTLDTAPDLSELAEALSPS